eukprot:6178560-Pleurochrysis_carterae.AAC.4
MGAKRACACRWASPHAFLSFLNACASFMLFLAATAARVPISSTFWMCHAYTRCISKKRQQL